MRCIVASCITGIASPNIVIRNVCDISCSPNTCMWLTWLVWVVYLSSQSCNNSDNSRTFVYVISYSTKTEIKCDSSSSCRNVAHWHSISSRKLVLIFIIDQRHSLLTWTHDWDKSTRHLTFWTVYKHDHPVCSYRRLKQESRYRVWVGQ